MAVWFQRVRFENMAGMLPYERMFPGRRTQALLALFAALSLGGCQRPAPITAAAPGPATGPIDRERPLPNPLPKTAARVDGQVITTARVAALASGRTDRGNLKDGPNAGVLREALQQLIVRELLFQEALRRGLTADTRVVERTYDEVRATEPDDQHWLQRLAREGIGPDEFKQELRMQATVARLVSSLAERTAAQIGEEEGRAYLGAHPELGQLPLRWRVSQILLRTGPASTPPERQALVARSEALLRRLKAGEDFAALVREVAEDRTAPAGDRISSELDLAQGSLDPKFEQVLEGLKPGEISEIVPSALGLHILKLREVLPAVELPSEAALRKVRDAILAGERQKAADALVKLLEARARIEVFL